MAGQLQNISQRDFSGGVNAVASPYDLGQKQVARIRNLLLDEHGSMRTRDGYVIFGTAQAAIRTDGSYTNQPVVYRGVLNKTDLTSHPFVLVGHNAGFLSLFDTTNPNNWVGINNTVQQYLTPQSTTVIDEEVIALGYETPKIYNGTTLVPITASGGQTVPTGAKHLVFHLGSIWLWNTNGSTTTLDGPSSIRMSDINNPNSWPNANQTFIGKDDGQVGMGLATFTIAETGIAPTQTLVAFKNFSAYQITGVFGATNFAVQKIKSDMGCTAPRSIQFVSGFGIVRLSHRGFALYDGVNDKLISEEIRPYIFGNGTDIAGLNFAAIDRSWASQGQNPPLYICACPTTDTSLTRFFIYDLVRRAWSIVDFPTGIQTLALLTIPGTQPIVQAGTTRGLQILTLFNGALDDAGVPIDWSFRTKNHFIGSPTQLAFWRRMLMDVSVTPTLPVPVTATLNGQAVNLMKTLLFTDLPPAGTWGGPTTFWGSFTWGSNPLVDTRADMGIMRYAPSVFFDVSGTGRVIIRALDVQGRSKPLTRSTI